MAEQKKETTKDFVAIAEIRDNVAILKDGSLRSVIEVGSTNFELKSADEQTATIQAFQNFLNSIDFPIQISVSSRKLDIAPYIKSLDEITQNLKNELLKVQAVEYARFIKGLTELSNIMAKKFYIVVPLYLVETVGKETGQKAGIFDAFKSIVSPSSFTKSLSDQELENYKIQLSQKIEFITNGISGLGIESRVLNKDELIKTYYSYYNPGHSL